MFLYKELLNRITIMNIPIFQQDVFYYKEKAMRQKYVIITPPWNDLKYIELEVLMRFMKQPQKNQQGRL